jgi:hypothetical protein
MPMVRKSDGSFEKMPWTKARGMVARKEGQIVEDKPAVKEDKPPKSDNRDYSGKK